LEDLPAADELRRIVVQKPEALVTADPGLATVPPEQLSVSGEEQKSATKSAESESSAQDPAPSASA
jgi:hypothetical protein